MRSRAWPAKTIEIAVSQLDQSDAKEHQQTKAAVAELPDYRTIAVILQQAAV